AVAGRARIIVDGSITRGTDVVKAIALGADAVAVGRLYVYGLAAAGREGVVRLFEILEDEIRICLSLLGVTGYAELDRSYLRAAPPVVPPHVHSPFPHLDLLLAPCQDVGGRTKSGDGVAFWRRPGEGQAGS